MVGEQLTGRHKIQILVAEGQTVTPSELSELLLSPGQLCTAPRAVDCESGHDQLTFLGKFKRLMKKQTSADDRGENCRKLKGLICHLS